MSQDYKGNTEGYIFAVASNDPFILEPMVNADQWDLLAVSDGRIHGDPYSSLEEMIQQVLPEGYLDFDTHLLPYYVEQVRQLAPSASVEEVTIEVAEADRKAIMALPGGGIVLVVSHAPPVLPFASVFLRSLRGDEVFVDARPLSAAPEWGRLAPAADLVLADMLSAPALREAGARRVREVHVVSPRALERLREALTVVTPRS